MTTDSLNEGVADAWGDWISSMGEWHVFGALTYDPGRVRGMPGSDVVRANARRWLGGGLRTIGRPVEAAVVALEYQRSGWPHLHPLLRVAGGVQPGEIAELAKVWTRRWGRAKLERPRDAHAVAAYAAKYLAKDLSTGDVIFWPPRGPLTTHQPALAP